MIKEITILAFNFGLAGKVVNGPGLCLYNFCNFLKQTNPEIKINVFTQLEGNSFDSSWKINSISEYKNLVNCIKNSDIIHHWSGLDFRVKDILNLAISFKKKIVLGPNLIDGVQFNKEKDFLKNLNFNLLLTVNDRLRYLISKLHNLNLNKIQTFLIGPDLDLWKPIDKRNRTILWKGNSQQFVKDVKFGLDIAKQLPQYEFKFLGYPRPYDYLQHIEEAKSCYLYFSTSLSETMGLAMVESMAAKLPVVIHPQIYLHGINYQTGIITNRDLKSYCQAIEEIMEDEQLYQNLSQGAYDFVQKEFNKDKISDRYFNLMDSICM